VVLARLYDRFTSLDTNEGVQHQSESLSDEEVAFSLVSGFSLRS